MDNPFENPHAEEWLEAFEEEIKNYELSGYDQLSLSNVKKWGTA